MGFANLPNQVHRKSVKKGKKISYFELATTRCTFLVLILTVVLFAGFEFTLMVAGESGLGKSTLIDR